MKNRKQFFFDKSVQFYVFAKELVCSADISSKCFDKSRGELSTLSIIYLSVFFWNITRKFKITKFFRAHKTHMLLVIFTEEERLLDFFRQKNLLLTKNRKKFHNSFFSFYCWCFSRNYICNFEKLCLIFLWPCLFHPIFQLDLFISILLYFSCLKTLRSQLSSISSSTSLKISPNISFACL